MIRNLLLLLMSIQMNSQNTNTDTVFVLIDKIQNKNLYIFEKGKNNKSAKIKILHYDKRNEGFKRIKQIKANKEIIQVKSEPNDNIYYEFVSNNSPKSVENINGLKVYSIEDVSKNNKKVWSEYPYIIFFIEQLECSTYNIWKMNPLFHE